MHGTSYEKIQLVRGLRETLDIDVLCEYKNKHLLLRTESQ